MKIHLVFMIAWLLSTSFLRADSQIHWTRAGPFDRPGKSLGLALWQDPTAHNHLIAGIRPEGLFSTADAGLTWHRVSAKIKTSLDAGSNPQSIAADPSNPKIVYAGLEMLGCYKSEDGGESWTRIISGLARGRARNGVCVAVHPQKSQIVFYGSDAGLFRSTDAGATWHGMHKGLPTGQTVGSKDVSCTISQILFDSTNPTEMYVAIYAVGEKEVAGCYRSADGGDTWQAANEGIETGWKKRPTIDLPYRTEWSFDLAQAPSHPGILYLAATGGLYRSADSARTWQRTAFSESPFAIAVDPHNPDRLATGGGGADVQLSHDGGKTWHSITGDLPTEMLPGSPTYNVEFKMPDGSTKKVQGSDGRYMPTVMKLFFDNADPSRLWMANHVGVYSAKVK